MMISLLFLIGRRLVSLLAVVPIRDSPSPRQLTSLFNCLHYHLVSLHDASTQSNMFHSLVLGCLKLFSPSNLLKTKDMSFGYGHTISDNKGVIIQPHCLLS